MKGIFSHIKAAFAKVFGVVEKDAPGIEKTATASLAVVAPLLETTLTLCGEGEAATEAGMVIGKIQTDLADASKLLAAGGTDPSLPSILSDVKANLGSIESIAQIKNPETQAKVSGVVSLIVTTIEEIEAELPA